MKKIKLVYAGLRVVGSSFGKNDRVLHCLMHGKKELYFPKMKIPIMGYEYEAEIDAKGEVWFSSRAKMLEQWPRFHEVSDQWELAHELALEHRKMKRAANRSFKPIDNFLGPLITRYHCLKGWDERIAFLSYVSRRIREGKP